MGSGLNVERGQDGAEIGGHPLSGHVDATARIAEIRRPENNVVLRVLRLIRPGCATSSPKGYIGVNGCSLTVAESQRERDGSGWFEVWLIPETLRMTTFAEKRVGDAVHLEIDRSTQVVVDTVRDALDESWARCCLCWKSWRANAASICQLALPKTALPR